MKRWLKYLLDDIFKPQGILVDWQITRWAMRGGIVPFDPALVNPCSVNIQLSGVWKSPVFDYDGSVKGWRQYEADEIYLQREQFILGSSLQTFSFDRRHYGQMSLTSSMARQGLNHHLAGWVDVGFGRRVYIPRNFHSISMAIKKHVRPTLTFELTSKLPIRLHRGQSIAQLAVYRTAREPDRDYALTGRYTGQVAPQEAINEQTRLK